MSLFYSGAFIHPVDPVLLFFFAIPSAEKEHQASLAWAGRQIDVWLKSLPSEMSPEASLPKAGFHRAFMGSMSAMIHVKKAGIRRQAKCISSGQAIHDNLPNP